MNKKIIFLVLVCFSFISCSKEKKSDFDINVVTTTFPCFDAVRAVVGNNDKINIKMLVKPAAEVHSFDPSPSDIISIKKSDLFVYIGGESDEWVKRLITEENIYSLKLADHVFLLEEEHHHDEEGDDESEEHHHEEINPHEKDEHIWTSPENEIVIINEVLESLCKIAKDKNLNEYISVFEENAKNYINQINEVSLKIKNVVQNAKNNFIVMADRFPFVYFAEYFGIEYISAFNGCSTAVEVGTAKIAELIDVVKQKKLSAIFYIELGNHKLCDTIAESCNVDILPLESIQTVSKKDFDNKETWVSLMYRNCENLRKGMN